ncbi:MAG: hypothetical protein HOC71_04870 [Candidatus Latescibacteria bacterium]|nr:hypothetical protein [Candidatus Latescibacterota bacterium]
MSESHPMDGVHALIPSDQMFDGARKLRAAYEMKPDNPLYRSEFGYNSRWGVEACYYCLDQWYEQGLSPAADLVRLFGYDPQGKHCLGQLGACEAEMVPQFEEKVLEERGEYEVIRDAVGRHLLVFKGRRQGFMPEYISHPVRDIKSWEEKVKWRLAPSSTRRFKEFENRMSTARREAAIGMMITQDMVGGYMYLRSLIGPVDLLYAFHDMPELIHECMKSWLDLADFVIARHQQHITIDELFFDEDICYNHGLLISPDMIREFLFPYYQQLISNIKSRQPDRSRHLYVQFDIDGFVVPAIDLYREGTGMDVISPLEAAAGCDVVDIGKKYPDLVMFGGIDKRVLAAGTEAIDLHLENIIPVMKARGGYVPTCDHGVPAEVSLKDYRYYRKRVMELGG